MRVETRGLGIEWINHCIGHDDHSELRHKEFFAFIRNVIRDQYQLEPSDIQGIIAESEKEHEWNDMQKTAFVDYWYPKYEIIEMYIRWITSE